MYFAKIDVFRKVLKVIKADQDYVDLLPGTWIPCDVNGVFPKNYPGIGSTYDPDLQVFILPRPYPSWILNEDFKWEAPISRPPGTSYQWKWNEEQQNWIANE